MEDNIKLTFTGNEIYSFEDLFTTWDDLKTIHNIRSIYSNMCSDIAFFIIDSWLFELENILRVYKYTDSFLQTDKEIKEILSTIHKLHLGKSGMDEAQCLKSSSFFKCQKTKDKFIIFLPKKYLPSIKNAIEAIKNIKDFVYEDYMKTFRYMFVECEEDKIKHCFEMINKYCEMSSAYIRGILTFYDEKLGGYLK